MDAQHAMHGSQRTKLPKLDKRTNQSWILQFTVYENITWMRGGNLFLFRIKYECVAGCWEMTTNKKCILCDDYY